MNSLVAGLVLVTAMPVFAGHDVVVWAAPSYERVMLKQQPKTQSTIHLIACRNETESLQVVATGKSHELAALEFDFDSATNASGERLPVPSLFWQYDVPVTRSSPRARRDSIQMP